MQYLPLSLKSWVTYNYVTQLFKKSCLYTARMTLYIQSKQQEANEKMRYVCIHQNWRLVKRGSFYPQRRRFVGLTLARCIYRILFLFFGDINNIFIFNILHVSPEK